MKPKKLTKAAILGERGVHFVSGIVLEMGFAWYPTGQVEAGIDGHIELRDVQTEEAFNTLIGVQSKATDQAFPNETPDGFDFYCKERDVDYWLKGNLPVIVVVCRPSTHEGYWISAKEYFSDPGRRGSKTIHFNKRVHAFTAGCRDPLLRLAAAKDAGLYLAPPLRSERLVSNLLPVVLPDRLYVGDTPFRRRGEIYAHCREIGRRLSGEWVLHEKKIVSFFDLRRPEWSGICDRGSTDDFGLEEWEGSDDVETQKVFASLLHQTLREMVRQDLGYHERLELFYFHATPDLSAREVDYQGLSNASDRTVFKPYLSQDGAIKYCRHSAFEERFLRLDDEWYLEINPTYFFSLDGYHSSRSRDGLLKGIKQIEKHEAVRGQLLMWASFLTPRGDLFNSEPYPFLGFKDLVTFQIDRGIDDQGWGAGKLPQSDAADDSVDLQPVGPLL